MFVKSDLPDFVNKEEFKKFLKTIIDLANNGLKIRGYSEEKLLEPLYKRANSLENPAQRVINHIKNFDEDLNTLILDYARTS
jgi:hypothetical protein